MEISTQGQANNEMNGGKSIPAFTFFLPILNKTIDFFYNYNLATGKLPQRNPPRLDLSSQFKGRAGGLKTHSPTANAKLGTPGMDGRATKRFLPPIFEFPIMKNGPRVWSGAR